MDPNLVGKPIAGTMDGRNPHGASSLLQEGQTRPSKFSDFKPIVSAKTPLSMMQNSAGHGYTGREIPYRESSRGVVPGYQGHVPRARDTYGTSAVGGLAPEPHVGAHKKLGPMTGHDNGSARLIGPNNPGTTWNPMESTGRVLGWEDAETVFPEYKDKKQGVMPGYAGFRPGSRDHHNHSAFGGIAQSGPEGQGPNLKPAWDQGRGHPGVNYKATINGILPGYKGHVPEAIMKAGESHFGSLVQPWGGNAGHYNVAGAQSGHETNGNAFDKAYEVDKMAKSGYSGHVPGARDTYGTTVYNAE